MKRWLWMALLLCSSAQAVSLEELQQRFSQQPVLRAAFEQQRNISGIKQPLRSSGQLIISQQKGLWWAQKTPFPLTLLLNDQRMVQTLAGQAPQVIDAQNNPQMFQFNHLLTALFHADSQVLQQNFDLNFTDKGQGSWQLILTPKTTPLDKLFRTIQLEGGQFLDQILINDMQGDNTHIRFFDQQIIPAQLTDDEQLHFSS